MSELYHEGYYHKTRQALQGDLSGISGLIISISLHALGLGVPQDESLARVYHQALRAQAERGVDIMAMLEDGEPGSDSEFALALVLLYGLLGELQFVKAKQHLLSCKDHHPTAKIIYLFMQEDGLLGEAPGAQELIDEYLGLLNDYDDPLLHYRLACLYLRELDTEADLQKALDHLHQAACSGHIAAAYQLAVLHKRGGELAAAWAYAAYCAQEGYAESAHLFRELEDMVSKDQRMAAKTLYRDFLYALGKIES